MTSSVRLLSLAIMAALACLIAWSLAPEEFFTAYLAAVMLPWSVSVGSLALLLMFILTGGKWGRAAWPWLVMNARLMPLVGILFIPILFGIDDIYPWANSDILTQFDRTENRQWFYQTPFFVGRTMCYFVIWSALAWMTRTVVVDRDPPGAPYAGESSPGESSSGTPSSGDPSRRLRCSVYAEPLRGEGTIVGGQAVAGWGAIAVLLTITWAGIDWVMSFDPFFGSTLFGALIGMGGMLSAISATVAAVCFWTPLRECATDGKTAGDLGSLLLAFLMLWAYFSFAQFLIMWMGDLPRESHFYAIRSVGVWGWISPLLCVIGFAVPFLCLLSHDFKRTPRKVGTLAIGLLFVRMIELWWMVLPADGQSAGNTVTWSIIPATIAVVACYLAGLSWLADRASTSRQGETTHVT